ncbi:MAG: ribbon-helix-helix protein, CopG family [Thermoleophilaceae bacterium]|nr:ribbon-helix-helix protein, CopG family [Thermoleophilaceae bacterium]
MAHRTQIMLTDDQYDALKRRSRETGSSLAELIRRAVEQTYREADERAWEQAMEKSFGAWADRDIGDSVDYVKSLRGPGLGSRLGF